MTGIVSNECVSDVSAAVELSVEEALYNWRRNAVEIFMASSLLFYLPGILLLIWGHGPPIAWTMHLLIYTSYLALVLAAFLRTFDYRIRLYTVLSMAYLIAIFGAAAYPGPFMRALPIALPVIGLVFSGVRCGRITATVSVLVILSTPFLSRLPLLTMNLRRSVQPSLEPVGLMFSQAVGLMAILLLLMVLLERFYRFLGRVLIDQHRAVSDVERKVIELTKAHDTLAREIDERRKLEREVTRIADEEKRRLGLEIHDGVCQQITGALLRSGALAHQLDRGQPATTDDIEALSTLLEEAIDEAHGVAKGLCPLESRPDAIEAAIRTLTRRTQRISGVSCRFITTGDIRIPDPVTAQHLFRIAQEAVSNAARHARATRITVELHGARDGIHLQVEDNGEGMPTPLPSGGMGLRTMACRAHLLAGEFTITPVREGGTCVRCIMPRTSPSHTLEKSNPAGDVIHG